MVESEPSEVCSETSFRSSDSKVSKTRDTQATANSGALHCRYNRCFAAKEIKRSVIKMPSGSVGVLCSNFTAPAPVVVKLGTCTEIFAFRTQNYYSTVFVVI